MAKPSEDSPLSRIYVVTGCKTQVELAGLLGIRQSSISDAKRRGVIPADWLIKLLRQHAVNPDWVLFGTLPKYISDYLPRKKPGEKKRASRYAKVVNDILRCLPLEALLHEIRRRGVPG